MTPTNFTAMIHDSASTPDCPHVPVCLQQWFPACRDLSPAGSSRHVRVPLGACMICAANMIDWLNDWSSQIDHGSVVTRMILQNLKSAGRLEPISTYRATLTKKWKLKLQANHSETNPKQNEVELTTSKQKCLVSSLPANFWFWSIHSSHYHHGSVSCDVICQCDGFVRSLRNEMPQIWGLWGICDSHQIKKNLLFIYTQ